MSWELVIVESPSKAKTIQNYLGKKYHVLACYGHVIDLVPKGGAVTVDENVQMKYQVIEKNKGHLEEILTKAKKASSIILATDPDREGEAIAYHIVEYLKNHISDLQGKTHRALFYEITKNAIVNSLQNMRALNLDLVNAQQARRALDYLVGFSLSPVLWRKVRPKLSAGRVQSPALRLIAEREQEITSFQKREYWSLHAVFPIFSQSLSSKLVVYKGKKLQQFSIESQEAALAAKDTIMTESGGVLQVSTIDKKTRKRSPAPPFTTSTLQQEASRKLNLSTAQTMRLAQQLYEGVDTADGQKGLITYMRTDSVALSKDALSELRALLKEKYGADFLAEKIRQFTNKSKNAQEAHEAIRPTDFYFTPEKAKTVLSRDQFRLYKLIWERCVTTQMSDAIFEDQSVQLAAKNQHAFEARSSTLLFPGFLKVYQEGKDEEEEDLDETEDLKSFAKMSIGDVFHIQQIETKQHFTEPPPRFSEASLVKSLESFGIGRPSTYASIISTLKTRGYAEIKQKRFYPTDIGTIVNQFLTKYFNNVVDYEFTAGMENLLDDISNGEKNWNSVVKDFWGPFKANCEHITANVSKREVTDEQLDESCPECSSPLVKKLGKKGRFIGCSKYPDCSFTKRLTGESALPDDLTPLDRKCPSCEAPLDYRQGRFGVFIGCTGYPKCKHIESLKKANDTNVKCPACQEGTIVEKKSRRGTSFFACSKYPSCKQAYSGAPVEKSCPTCASPILLLKDSKRIGMHHSCPNKECGFKQPLSATEGQG